MMTLIKPTCMYCQKEIQDGEEALVAVPYPKKKGFTEIQAYLKLEGKFICESCLNRLEK